MAHTKRTLPPLPPQDRPTLLFFENHTDPRAVATVRGLVPFLKSLGYKCFVEEMPPMVPKSLKTGRSEVEVSRAELSTAIELEKRHLEHISHMRVDAESLKPPIEITEEKGFKEYFKKIVNLRKSRGETIDEKKIAEEGESLWELIHRRRGISMTLELYKEVQKAGFMYIPADIPELMERKGKSKEELLDVAVSKEGIDKRDISLFDALSTHPDSVGRFGLFHAWGLHKLAAKIMSLEEASERFASFYVFDVDREMPMIPVEEAVRSGQVPYPLGMTMVPISRDVTEEMAQEMIVLEITEKIAKLQERNEKAKAAAPQVSQQGQSDRKETGLPASAAQAVERREVKAPAAPTPAVAVPTPAPAPKAADDEAKRREERDKRAAAADRRLGLLRGKKDAAGKQQDAPTAASRTLDQKSKR